MKNFLTGFLISGAVKLYSKNTLLSFGSGAIGQKVIIKSKNSNGVLGAALGAFLGRGFVGSSTKPITKQNTVEWIATEPEKLSLSPHVVNFNGVKVSMNQLIDLVDSASKRDEQINFIFTQATSNDAVVLSQMLADFVGLRQKIASGTFPVAESRQDLIDISQRILNEN